MLANLFSGFHVGCIVMTIVMTIVITLVIMSVIVVHKYNHTKILASSTLVLCSIQVPLLGWTKTL